VSAGGPVEPGLAVDEELTKLLIYRHAFAAADDRLELVSAVRDRLAQVIGASGPDDDGPPGFVSFPEGIDAVSTEMMMGQASYRAASLALASPVRLSLQEFLA
jgi:hypothetical protein